MTVALLASLGLAASVLLIGAVFASEERGRVLGRAGERARVASTSRSRRTFPRWTAVAAAGGLGAGLGALVAGPPGVVAGSGAAALPIVVRRRRDARRAQRTEEQLIDAVAAVASALRSGRSLVQSLQVAAQEVGDPLGPMLAEAVDRAALGIPLDEILDALAERIGGSDGRLLTGVLRLHRRTGGALAASMDDVSRTLRARRDGARELRSLTAQSRLSAAILGLLPLGFFLFLSVVSRRDIEAAYRTTAGASAIGLGLALQGAAFLWIRHLLHVEDA